MPPANITMTASYIPVHDSGTWLSAPRSSEKWHENPYLNNMTRALVIAGTFFLPQFIFRRWTILGFCGQFWTQVRTADGIENDNAATAADTTEPTTIGADLELSALPMEALNGEVTLMPHHSGSAEPPHANTAGQGKEVDTETVELLTLGRRTKTV